LPRAYREAEGGLVPVDPPTAGYRLPTEAEWAFAARFAGRTAALKFPWGDRLPPAPGSANFADLSAANTLPEILEDYQDRHPATAPVDAFAPDERGLRQMGGNVAEWVQDVYTTAPSRSGTLDVDPIGPADGSLHVIRGSSWMDATVSELRLSYRDYGGEARPDVGFRIARYWKIPEPEGVR
jgi:formylglycine-generating enzyme required for sulfatase activity